uniref:Uncharacterized protein n=1 Tax=Trypanosoma congolense (strain IL3000) TaxID=1068625 RepID=G0UWS1_TRYCI|nr:conserved hypothetical protein [Trypanosoma congolense IL3000]
MPLRTDYVRYSRAVREEQNVSLPVGFRRLADLHLTAYPSVLNSAELPPGDAAATTNEPAVKEVRRVEKSPVMMITTNQMTALLTQMAKEPIENATKGTPLGEMNCTEMDRKTTYRLDYCNTNVPPFHARQRVIPDHMENWTATEKDNVKEAKKFPYLSVPQSLLNNRRTVYRHDYNATATAESYRTVPHTTNLHEVPSSFAYSAYTANDPRRIVKYDELVASCRKPSCLLWKSYSPRDSLHDIKAATGNIAEELRLLQKRREQSQRARERGSSEGAKSSSEEPKKQVLLPGVRGKGYRMGAGTKENYVVLPRDHFCHRVVYDY